MESHFGPFDIKKVDEIDSLRGARAPFEATGRLASPKRRRTPPQRLSIDDDLKAQPVLQSTLTEEALRQAGQGTATRTSVCFIIYQ